MLILRPTMPRSTGERTGDQDMQIFEPSNREVLRAAEIVDAVLAHRYARAVVHEIGREPQQWLGATSSADAPRASARPGAGLLGQAAPHIA
jgi:hypothetical protein